MTAKGFIVSKLFFYQKILFQPKIIESSQSKILFENNGPEVWNCYRMNQNHLLLISMVKSVSNHTYLTEPELCRMFQIHFSFFVVSFVWFSPQYFPNQFWQDAIMFSSFQSFTSFKVEISQNTRIRFAQLSANTLQGVNEL